MAIALGNIIPRKDTSLGYKKLYDSSELHHEILRNYEDTKQIKKLISEVSLKVINSRDTNDETPLHMAVHVKSAPIVRALIKNGADVNAKNFNGETPLHIAALFGYRPISKELIYAHANIDARDKRGNTPLHLATRYRNLEEVRFLLSVGANPFIKNNDGVCANSLSLSVNIERLFLDSNEIIKGAF